MGKAILISIQPQFVEKILNGEKTIEIRKTAPKCNLPCKVYIYCTKEKNIDYGLYKSKLSNFNKLYYEIKDKSFLFDRFTKINNKVVAEFVLNKVEKANCCVVPYDKEASFGYGKFVDNGVYQLKNDDGFVFEREDPYIDTMLKNEDFEKMQLKPIDVFNYIGDFGKTLYDWHIDDLKIYDEPKELSEFYVDIGIDEETDLCIDCPYHEIPVEEEPCKSCDGNRNYLKRPPQSYQFVEELED